MYQHWCGHIVAAVQFMEVVLFMEVLFIEQQLEFPIFILHGTKNYEKICWLDSCSGMCWLVHVL